MSGQFGQAPRQTGTLEAVVPEGVDIEMGEAVESFAVEYLMDGCRNRHVLD